MVCSVDRMGTLSSAVTNWEGGGLPRGRFLTSFGSWNLLDSDENTPDRNTYRPTLSHTIARWRWGESSIIPETHSQTPLESTPCRWKTSELNSEFMQIYHLVSSEFQKMQLRERFCPSQNQTAAGTPLSDKCTFLCKTSILPTSLLLSPPIPYPSTRKPVNWWLADTGLSVPTRISVKLRI